MLDFLGRNLMGVRFFKKRVLACHGGFVPMFCLG